MQAETEARTARQRVEPSKPQSSAKKKASLPDGPAIQDAVTGPDPCALISDSVIQGVLGSATLKTSRQRVNRSALLDPPDSVAKCEWQSPSNRRVTIELGSKYGTNDVWQKAAESIAGLGDEAWIETGYERSQRVRVRLGERYLVVTAGSNKQAMISLAKEAIAALPSAPELRDRLYLGDVVGAPAVKPCNLVSAEVLAKIRGGGSFMTLPKEEIGGEPGSNYVSCYWSTKNGLNGVEVSLYDAAYWQTVVKWDRSSVSVAGHEARMETDFKSLVTQFDGWTLEVGLRFDDIPKAVRRERIVELAEAVIAELPAK